MDAPLLAAVEAAIEIATGSPCAGSKRGVVIFWRGRPNVLLARGHNAPPGAFRCDGTQDCRDVCREICVHAEVQALLNLKVVGLSGLELVHVKVVDGQLVPSGPPSCHRCSAVILAAAIDTVWLFHESGWRAYAAATFHRLSLDHNRIRCAVVADSD